jgi:hypothetical protein
MEGVINSNLSELDVTPDAFYEACQKSRDGRDINRRVFEKLMAMEDFTVFKKIMVKRNTELQFEAMQAYKEYAGLSLSLGVNGGQEELEQLPNPDELEQMLGDKEDDLEAHGGEYDPEKVGERSSRHALNAERCPSCLCLRVMELEGEIS